MNTYNLSGCETGVNDRRPVSHFRVSSSPDCISVCCCILAVAFENHLQWCAEVWYTGTKH